MQEGHSDLNRRVRELTATLTDEQREHADRVAVYAVATAIEMGTTAEISLTIRYSGQLHEAAPCPFPGAAELIEAMTLPWNGAGAEGPVGNSIPFGGRILAVAHEFDVLTMPPRPDTVAAQVEALEYLKSEGGRRFDPAVVSAFIHVQRLIQPLGL